MLDLLRKEEEEENKKKSVLKPEATPVLQPEPQPSDTGGGMLRLIRKEIAEEDDEVVATTAQRNIDNNTAVQEAAVRFVHERLGMTNITDPEEAMEEYMEHFRSFNVNELTAGGDYRYVSAAAADAKKKKDKKAARRLSDYRLLYQTFNEMPAFSDDVFTATGDYLEGLVTAPSTYVGLLLPGAGKASGFAATQIARAGVNKTLMQAFKTPISSLATKAAANPIKTTVIAEGIGGSLQNIAEQKTELEADLRDDYSVGQTALAFGLSAALPAAGVAYGAKKAAKQFIEKDTPDLIAKVAEVEAQALKEAKKTLKQKKDTAKTAREALAALDPKNPILRPLDETMVAEGKAVRESMEEGLDIDPMMLSFTPEKTERIWAGVVDIMDASGLKKDPTERITEFVARSIDHVAKKDPEKAEKLFADILDKYNLSSDDLKNLVMADASDWGRKGAAMATASRLSSRLSNAAANKIFGLDDEALKTIKEVDEALEAGDVRLALNKADKIDGKVQADSFARKLDTVRLAAMTSQTATTVRNGVGGFGRAGIDGVTKLVDRGIASGLKSVGLAKGKKGLSLSKEDIMNDSLSVIYGMVNTKESNAIKEIFKAGFDHKAEILYRQLRDINNKTGSKEVNNWSRSIARELNALNQLTDDFFKQAVFSGSLKRQLGEMYEQAVKRGENPNKEDFNLLKIIQDGGFVKVFNTKEGKGVLDKAVEDSLYFTYQANPKTGLGKAFVNSMNSLPFVTTSFVPFPRFIANAMRFTYEYSPAYVFQGAYRSFAKDDNYEEIAKSLVGTGILAGAVAFRSSENAGENWYEYKMDDGRTFDMRPFFPAAPYLFFADLYVRAKNDMDFFGDRNAVADSVQALTGTQFRAGFGAYAIDSAIRDFMRDDVDKWTKAEKIGAEFVSNLFSTYTIPLTFGQDVYNTWLAPDDEVIARQTNSTNLFDMIVAKSTARIPANYALQKRIQEMTGESSWLPKFTAPEELELATRAETPRRMLPITRQLTGALLRERKNFLEKEMARLKISPRKLSQKTGVPEADQLINRLLGEYAVEYIVPVLKNSEDYKSRSPSDQALFIKDVIDDYRADIIKLVKLQSKYGGADRYGFDPMSRVGFNRLNSRSQNKAYERYHKLYGKPTEKRPYDYQELERIGKIYESIGVRPVGGN